MDHETLQGLEWHYASRLYDELKKTYVGGLRRSPVCATANTCTSDTLTFNTWSIFLKAFPEHIDHDTAFRYYEEKGHASTTPLQLPSMINRMAKLDASMLTFLCVRNFTLNLEHLIALTKISTLTVLSLERASSPWGFSKETILAQDILNWGRSVRQGGGFKKLKVLVFGKFGPQDAVLNAALDFPALNLVGVLGSRARHNDCSTYDSKGVYTIWHSAIVDKKNEDNAASIWLDRTTTKAEKMRKHYDFSRKLSQQAATVPNSERSISMLYCRDERVEDAEVLWYHRELGDSVTQSAKRPGFADKQDDRNSDGSKKRKVREDKKRDVGSLLGSFT
jgi:hypothetical protein